MISSDSPHMTAGIGESHRWFLPSKAKLLGTWASFFTYSRQANLLFLSVRKRTGYGQRWCSPSSFAPTLHSQHFVTVIYEEAGCEVATDVSYAI